MSPCPQASPSQIPFERRKQFYRKQLSSHEIDISCLPAEKREDEGEVQDRDDGLILYRNHLFRQQNMLQMRAPLSDPKGDVASHIGREQSSDKYRTNEGSHGSRLHLKPSCSGDLQQKKNSSTRKKYSLRYKSK